MTKNIISATSISKFTPKTPTQELPLSTGQSKFYALSIRFGRDNFFFGMKPDSDDEIYQDTNTELLPRRTSDLYGVDDCPIQHT